MAQAERLSQLAAERHALIMAGAPAAGMSGTLLGMQDRHAALSNAIVNAETRISDVMRQKQDSQANRGVRTQALLSGCQCCLFLHDYHDRLYTAPNTSCSADLRAR